ncbi:endopeptidase La [Candidatus Acetothermia bacterium]|nr:endopeptidase La [Candidatus Acetothermia bacterium]MBI3643443.1 endopeptidase La [Candidatus Acetothermia bacterium]
MDEAKILEETEIEPIDSDFPEVVPILPLRESVVFPQSLVPLSVGRSGSLKAVEDAMAGNKWLGVLLQLDPEVDEPTSDDLFTIGTLCRVIRVMKYPNQTEMVLVQGQKRFRVLDFTQEKHEIEARIEVLETLTEKSLELDALVKNMTSRFHKLVTISPNMSSEILAALRKIEDPGHLVDAIAAHLDMDSDEKQELLEKISVRDQLQFITRILERELEFLELGSKIETDVKGELERGMKERYLREKMEAIRRELGDDEDSEVRDMRDLILDAKMPPDIEKEAMKELDRLAEIHPSSPEYTVARTYLGWLVELPWSKRTKDRLDIEQAKKILDEDHYDLEKVKERILEYLAVLQLRSGKRTRMRGPIFCFVGPPGVGKTSLGQSVARALGRKFVRMSLGGVRDEAEIRGHRRTYIGSLPGRIIQGIRRAGTRNPVFMLDEIDKLGADYRGDPSSALLEVLDPEQNHKFQDHYLGVHFDLSQVLFIATANILDPVPPPLLDRMEILELPGYSEEDKIQIAKSFLIPRQVEEHGFRGIKLSFEESALKKLIREYTHEAGVRNMEREIASILRKVAVKALRKEKNPKKKWAITENEIPDFLGPPKHFPELAERVQRSGIAVGLVVTRVGGDIVFIEVSKMKGKGNLILTGQLGDVMKESAQAALSYIRSQAKELGIDPEILDKNDIHIHVPAGAIPKDGPSAGITIATALVSLLTNTPLKPDLAMTGETTLRGKVLPVGGIRDKVLAAHRAGVKTVILPKRNESDLFEVPENVRANLEFHFVDMIDEAFLLALARPSSRQTLRKPHRAGRGLGQRPMS